jgi:hypothetical protein
MQSTMVRSVRRCSYRNLVISGRSCAPYGILLTLINGRAAPLLLGVGVQQGFNHFCGGIDHMLAVVEHQHEMP